MEQLPDEIIEIIFKELQPSDIQNVMLVCHLFRNIVERSAALMAQIPLILIDTETDGFVDIEKKSIDLLMDSKRRVTTIRVELEHEKIMKFLGVFKTFGKTVRVMDITDYAFETIGQLRIVLRFLPNLQTLNVTNVSFLKGENKILNSIVQIPKFSLVNLRSLNCVDSDPKIFSLFTNNCDIQLRTIRLRPCGVQTNSNFDDFIEMMTNQKRLNALTLDGISDDCYIFRSHDFLRCQLEQLEIQNCYVTMRDQMRNIIIMIKDQRQLKVLKLHNTPIPPSMDIMFTYRQIFNNHITTAHLDIRQLAFFHSHHFTNLTVKHLTIVADFAFENLPIFINFIKMFPNVKWLKLVQSKGSTSIDDKYLFHILNTFKNLYELHVPAFTSRKVDSYFCNLALLETRLHTLVIDYIDYDVKFFGWKNIAMNLKSIEKLVIKKDFGKVSLEVVDCIITNLKLKHLELGIGVMSMEILRSIVYNNSCDQLKVLKMARSDLEKIDPNFDFRNIFIRNRLLLHLCDDDYFAISAR